MPIVLTYHAIESGPPPLCVELDLFRAHLDVIAEAGAQAVTVSELVEGLGAPEPGVTRVAITFDDGFASVAHHAAPLLNDRGLGATVYVVAGHLGGRNDWPSAAPGGFESRLASCDQVRELAAAGLEIGSHGFVHAPLTLARGYELEREIVGSKLALENLLGTPVRSYALPYGAMPDPEGRSLLEQTYSTVCTTHCALLDRDTGLNVLPRVDAHYLRRPELLRRALEGSLGPYLVARRIGARVRRAFRNDYSDA